MKRHYSQSVTLRFRSAVMLLCLVALGLVTIPASVYARPTRSTNIALTSDGTKLVNVNTDANSVTVFAVENGGQSLRRLAEIPVGREPHCVAVKGNGRAYVTNGHSDSVSVINLNTLKATKEIPVGTEPRGCALTPGGRRLYVANHTEGTVSVIRTSTNTTIDPPIEVGGNPMAIAITDDNDEDADETVFVTNFYARLRAGGPGEGFDDGKEGIVRAFTVGDPGTITEITLSPLAGTETGFTANRREFCNNTDTTDPDPANQTFCPDLTITDPTNPIIAQDPQGCFSNQLHAAIIRRGRLYLPNICAQPEPPVRFDVNVQAVIHVVDTTTLSEVPSERVNLNAQIGQETNTTGLGKLFGNDITAIDRKGDNFFIVSRGGNYVLRATLDADSKLNIGAPDNVVRFQTGNIPTGIVRRGQFAYVNNDVGHSVSILDLAANTVIERDVPSSTPPEPGSFAHSVLLGKLVFFTALGVPDNNLVGTPIRNIVPLDFRGKQSNNAWSTCASCHPAGLSDAVTWIFPDGPRNTLPLDALYSKLNGPHDTRINNWSAARDSVTDFNANSRAVQGGVGFASDPPFSAAVPNPAIFDHGISEGGSEALDFETTWAQTVRPFNMPQPANPDDLKPGAQVFADNCASCHGGTKWTKSQVLYLNNPALNKAFAAGGVALDPGLTIIANQMVQYVNAQLDSGTLKFLEIINTFDPANPIEIRGTGAAIGQQALGVLGFNVPSVLSVNYHAPFFHNGAAQTLEAVFPLHALGGGTIQDLPQADREALLVFLKALDGRTANFESEADIFNNPFQNLP